MLKYYYTNNNNTPDVIPKVGSENGDLYVALPPPCEVREIVSDRLSAQVKHIKNKYAD